MGGRHARALISPGALMRKRWPVHADTLFDPDESPTCSVALTSALKDTLALLAAIDSQHQEMRHKLERWTGPESIKQRFFEQLEARHQHERKPLVQRLADLQARIRSMLDPEARPVH
jgi:hypothetical protein